MAGIVPMVPEGLVLLTSVAFAIGVIRLGRKQCLVQELPAIEGLARVDMVCLDKTGTLTEGGMRRHRSCARWAARTSAYVPQGARRARRGRRPGPTPPCRRSSTPTRTATEWALHGVAPFSSARKWSGATFAEGDGENNTWLLGAPDVLWAAAPRR